MTSCQESPNPASSGEEFLSTKNKQTKVGEAMWSSSKQNKHVICHQSFFIRSTSLGVVEIGNLKLDFYGQKALEFIFFGLNTFIGVLEIPKPLQPFWLYLFIYFFIYLFISRFVYNL